MREKERILKELAIVPLNGMINSQQFASILTKRAELETGEKHIYKSDAVRRRVNSKSLKVAMQLHERMNLFHLEDAFTLELEPHKWHSKSRKQEEKKASQPSEKF